MLKLKFFLLGLVLSSTVAGQDLLNLQLDRGNVPRPLTKVLQDFSNEHQIRIYYLQSWLENLQSPDETSLSLGEILNSSFKGTDFYYVIMDNRTIVIVKDPTQEIARDMALQNARKREQTIEKIVFGETSSGSHGSEKVRLTGLVRDISSSDPVPYATVQSDNKMLASSDSSGRFVLDLDPGLHVLLVTSVDYSEKVIDLSVFENGELIIELERDSKVLSEILIQDERLTNVNLSRIGSLQLPITNIKRAPSFLGVADIVKQVQSLPGVTSVGEAASGFNVRGGSVDQNLILFDGLPVFNSSHVFGFFSSFNPEVVRNVTFLKGGIPANYGGRASSILDIKSSDGSQEDWKGKGSLGMITADIMLEGPLKERTSVLASLRSTYSDWFARSIRTDYTDLSQTEVDFLDASLKLTKYFSNDTKFSISGYGSHDSFKLIQDTTYNWNNFLISAQLDRQITSDLGVKYTAGLSSYGYSLVDERPSSEATLSFRILTKSASADYEYSEGNDFFKFGGQINQYSFNPGKLKPASNASNAQRIALDPQHSLEAAVYGSAERQINDQLSLEVGVRVPTFLSFGAGNVILYESNEPREIGTARDTLNYNRFQIMKGYLRLEPRMSLRYFLTPTSTIKFGYNRINQFLHLISNTAAITPFDIWQPSGYYLKPQKADQFSIGYTYQPVGRTINLTVEGFYKNIQDLVDFKDGADLSLNPAIETELLQGRGFSYGLETSIGKNSGRLTGNLNYTYSRSFREFEGSSDSESINEGRRYPSNFDQPHVLNLTWKYELSKRHFFTGNFTYHSGRPVTVPIAVLTLENTFATYFSDRNQYRIPNYHRLDIALVIEGNHRIDKRLKGAWVFSIYNVYARKNPYSVFFQEAQEGVPEPYQLSIIGTMVPSITYKFTFE